MSNHLHGLSNTKLYRKYRSMLDRCYNSNNKSYKDYGARGIKVCDEWLGVNGVVNFFDWSLKNGYEEGLTIERKDVNGDYCPSNCCYVTNAEQQRNKRNNVVFSKEGEEILEADLARKLGMTDSAIIQRVANGKDVFAPKFKRTKEVIRDDGVIYSSIREAGAMNGVHESKISAVCRGIRKRTAGHSFRFLTREEADQALEMQKG